MTEKTCTSCGETKPIDQFSRARNGTKQAGTIIKAKCKPCNSARSRKWYAANTERAKEIRRARSIKAYGMSVAEYEALHLAQGGVCAICGQVETVKRSLSDNIHRLTIDHCHDTGEVRGLLCNQCNRAIGLFKDNADLLRKAISYLKKE